MDEHLVVEDIENVGFGKSFGENFDILDSAELIGEGVAFGNGEKKEGNHGFRFGAIEIWVDDAENVFVCLEAESAEEDKHGDGFADEGDAHDECV